MNSPFKIYGCSDATDFNMKNPGHLSAHVLTDEQQAEWVKGMKLWEKEKCCFESVRTSLETRKT